MTTTILVPGPAVIVLTAMCEVASGLTTVLPSEPPEERKVKVVFAVTIVVTMDIEPVERDFEMMLAPVSGVVELPLAEHVVVAPP